MCHIDSNFACNFDLNFKRIICLFLPENVANRILTFNRYHRIFFCSEIQFNTALICFQMSTSNLLLYYLSHKLGRLHLSNNQKNFNFVLLLEPSLLSGKCF